MEREKISAFIICFNEEDHIAECIRSVEFCDEVIVVDSFSSDRTVEIARSMGAKVVQRKWSGYIDQKAFGLSQAQHEWVINLDADERVSPELRENILRVLESAAVNSSNIAGFYINRVVFYLGRWWRQGGWYPEWRLRFFRKGGVTWGGVEPHEKPIVTGRTEKLAGELYHYTYEDMDDHFQRLHNHSSVAAREEYREGRRANAFVIVCKPIVRALKFYFLKKGYREGTAGLIVAAAEGYYTFMKYAKLWEQQFNERLRKQSHES